MREQGASKLDATTKFKGVAMKKLVALACIAGASPAWAADVTLGVGVSAKSNDSTIYVPIDFGEKFRIEPLVGHSKAKSEASGFSTKSETLQIGAGFFRLMPLAESVRIYYGARLSYLDFEGQAVNFDGLYPFVTDVKGDGYRAAPTFGFEYAFNKHLSIGGEAEWFYQELDSTRDDTRSGTETRLILRLRF
jgi:hypothetical protein